MKTTIKDKLDELKLAGKENRCLYYLFDLTRYVIEYPYINEGQSMLAQEIDRNGWSLDDVRELRLELQGFINNKKREWESMRLIYSILD